MKTKDIIALGLSVIAITVSVISLWISAYRPVHLGIDYIGILVGILALLVTVLIGWQIYTFINIKKTSDKLKYLMEESSLNTQRGLALSEGAAANLYYYLLLKHDPLGLDYRYLYHMICSLYHTSNFGDMETCNTIVKALLEVVVNPEEIGMIKKCKERLILMLARVKRVDEIIRFVELVERISKIKVTPNEGSR